VYSDPAVDGYSGKALGEILINCLRKRLAALGGAQKLPYHFDMSRFLRSIRLAYHLARRVSQRFP